MSDHGDSNSWTGHLGFLAITHEAGGYLGGYLVTNTWGRPVEFRVSSAVQPNRIQQALYGPTLPDYLHGELIGRSLVEKTTTAVDLIVVNTLPAVALRNTIPTPVVALDFEAREEPPAGWHRFRHKRSSLPLLLPQKWREDESRIRQPLDSLDEALDLAEPFARIQAAVAEHRKLGVTARAA